MSPTESIIGIIALVLVAGVVTEIVVKVEMWWQEEKRKHVIERFEQ